MDNDNFSYMFCGENGAQWAVTMINGELIINNAAYERQDDDPTYDFAIAMHKVIAQENAK